MLGNDIQIKQLVGVGDVHLSFEPEQRVYCLIGENGIGKTKCLEALFKAYFSTNKLLFDLYFKGNHSFEYVDKDENKFKNIFTFGDTKICGGVSKSMLASEVAVIDVKEHQIKHFKMIIELF